MKRQGLGTFVKGHAYGEQFASCVDAGRKLTSF